MNITLKLDDTNWQNFVRRALSILGSSDDLLKKAFLVVWPKESVSHFDQEMGYEGAWAPWKASTRTQRISSEIHTALGLRGAGGRLTGRQWFLGEKKAAKARANAYKKTGQTIHRGGKLLQDTGTLKTQTTQNPIMTRFLRGIKVESPTPYSGFLDEGTRFMEARPFMWLGDDAQENMAKAFADMLGEGAGGMS